jgi:hypothetical protein
MIRAGWIVESLCAFAVGIAIAWGASSALRSGLEEPEMRNCGTDRPLFFRPLPEDIARSIAEACRAKIDRDGVVRRFEIADSAPVVVATRVIAFLFDPINLVMTVGFMAITLAAWRRYKRRLDAT